MMLKELAYVRSGDKGDIVTVGVIAHRPEVYPHVVAALEPGKIKELLGEWVLGQVECHPMDNIHAVVVVLRGGLGGGATSTLRLDQTGKSLGNALLRLAVPET